ncbi:MAG: WG repeat-containing protein [Bacteroidia bacterium]
MAISLLSFNILSQEEKEYNITPNDVLIDDAYPGSWILVEKNKKFGFVNDLGEEVVPVKYDKIYRFDKIVWEWALVEENGKLGFINRVGEEIVKPIYDKILKIDDFNFNSAVAVVMKNGKYGLINELGEEFVKTDYDNIGVLFKNE